MTVLITCLFACVISYGMHLKGGWIYYEATGPGSTPGSVVYTITVKQYLDCGSTQNQIDPEVYLGIFNGSTNIIYKQITIPRSSTEFITKGTFNPCISSPPVVCYRIDSYVQTGVELPAQPGGYILAVQRCCRIENIRNVSGSQNVGVTYTTSIPGIINGINFAQNNSAVFAQKDTVVVCYNGSFTFDFSAQDSDGDSLSYSFCDGLVGGGTGNNAARPNPPSSPPYSSVPYSSPYSGGAPMGSSVSIDPKTGLITGIAPSTTGDYVVAVCASEFRSGVKIGETKKEIHINVARCSLSAADLKPTYITCDGFTMSFQNESTSSLVSSYTWEFGDARSGVANISTAPTPTHTYSDTGTFIMKLRVESSGGCKDSAQALVRVYPGFTPDFQVTGSCFKNPFFFTDRTFTQYGVVDSWKWDFGDNASVTDTSTSKNVSYTYPGPGTNTATLIVTNSKGCIDTVSKQVSVNSTPELSLPFKDTLICSVDTLQLRAEGAGVYTWRPNLNIIGPNTQNPYVYPKDTTVYIVTLSQNGCLATDTVKVNVLDFITADAGKDTSICLTDTLVLRAASHGLQFSWTPTTGLFTPNRQNTLAQPLTSTTYYVTANLGKCQATDAVFVKVAPYPQAYAGADTSICFGTQAVLNPAISGSLFTWSPASTLQNPSVLNAVASPKNTTSYILTVRDTLGCPKPWRDTVLVKVVPPVIAFAGNDTNVLVNTPFQLNATGGTTYAWSPAIGLSNPNIANPVATLGADVEAIIYKVKVGIPEGCYSEDNISIKVFKTGPEIFVPSAFTPNNDGKNDILRAITVGMKSFTYFKIFNRWGQLLFSTTEPERGWDGKSGGIDQPGGTFVYVAEAVDYLGRHVVKKGTVVLIR